MANKEYQQKYYQANREKIIERNKKYYAENKEKVRDQQRQYYERNKEQIAVQRSQYYLANRGKIRIKQSEYYQTYKDIINTRRVEYINKTPHARMIKNLRSRLSSIIKNKSRKTMDLIGCDRKHLVAHLEVQFENGMTWDNYGEWAIDHHIPISAFNFDNKKELRACWHFSNLKPMWASDYLRKGNKICLER